MLGHASTKLLKYSYETSGLEINTGHSHAQLGVDEHQLAAGHQTAVGSELHRRAAVAAQLKDIARLEVGKLCERQVDPSQLDGQGDRYIE